METVDGGAAAGALFAFHRCAVEAVRESAAAKIKSAEEIIF